MVTWLRPRPFWGGFFYTWALLPLLTGSARRVVHGEIGCSKWKKTLAYLLVLPGSRAWIVRCGGRYDPQLVKRSSKWVSEATRAMRIRKWRRLGRLCDKTQTRKTRHICRITSVCMCSHFTLCLFPDMTCYPINISMLENSIQLFSAVVVNTSPRYFSSPDTPVFSKARL